MYIESKKTTTIIQKSLENISNVIPNIQFFLKKYYTHRQIKIKLKKNKKSENDSLRREIKNMCGKS